MSTTLTPPATRILRPGDPCWDVARRAWNLAVDQHPAAVAAPGSVADIAAAISFARRSGLRVAAQGTGHGAASLGSLIGTLLIKTHHMRHVTIDPVAMTARAEAPDPVRGRWFTLADIVQAGSPAVADEILRPLRSLAPARDTVGTVPVQALGQLRTDPDRPEPIAGDGLMLASLSPEAVGALLRAAGPEPLSLLTAVELRHAGGELGRVGPGNGALAAVDGEFALSAAGRAPTAVAAASVALGVEAVTSAMRPWSARQMYLNIAGTTRDPASFWPAPAYARLRSVKAAVGPGDLIHSNHPIPSAASGEKATVPEHQASAPWNRADRPRSSGKA